VVIAAYDRSALDQTGSAHFSPIGGFHAARDLVLVLDVARFKYPPHWIPAERLWKAMHPIDPATAKCLFRTRAATSHHGLEASKERTAWRILSANGSRDSAVARCAAAL